MKTRNVETLAWVAIYLGLMLIAVGIALQRGGAGFGWGVLAAGGLGVAAGAALIWLRSRMNDAS